MPRVRPSAIPRNSENVPSVTISGGALSFVIIAALSAPPSSPTTSVIAIATGIDRPASRQSPPMTTADSPIIEPTERSMPPVMMIGVMIRARRPISTLSRVTSNAFPVVAKLFPENANSRHSTAITMSRIHSLFGKSRALQSCSVLSGTCCGCEIASSIFLKSSKRDIGCQRRQNDPPLDSFFPKRIYAEKRQRCSDRPEQGDADHRADQRSATACDCNAADHDSGDRFQLKAYSRVSRNRRESNRVQHCGDTNQSSHYDEYPEHDVG